MTGEKVVCRNCNHSWRLQKPASKYSDGPRCSECGSRRLFGLERFDKQSSKGHTRYDAEVVKAETDAELGMLEADLEVFRTEKRFELLNTVLDSAVSLLSKYLDERFEEGVDDLYLAGESLEDSDG